MLLHYLNFRHPWQPHFQPANIEAFAFRTLKPAPTCSYLLLQAPLVLRGDATGETECVLKTRHPSLQGRIHGVSLMG